MRYSHPIHSLLLPVIAFSTLSCRSNGRVADSWIKGSELTPISSYGSYRGVDHDPSSDVSHKKFDFTSPPPSSTSMPARKIVAAPTKTKTSTPALPPPRKSVAIAPVKTKTPTPAPAVPAKKEASASVTSKPAPASSSKYRGFSKRPPRVPSPTPSTPSEKTPSPQE